MGVRVPVVASVVRVPVMTGVLCVGMAGMFVVSRVVGLPGYHEEWTTDGSLGLWALMPEALFVLLAWVRLQRGSEVVAVLA